MTVRYELTADLLRLIAEGDYEVDEVTGTFERALTDPKCPDPVSVLLDVRRSTSLEKRTPEEIARIVAPLQPHADRIGRRCAVLAASDVHYGLGRMGSVFAEEIGVEARIFREEEPALVWLGVKPPIDD